MSIVHEPLLCFWITRISTSQRPSKLYAIKGKCTYFLWKLPFVYYSISVYFCANTWSTDYLKFWICFWFDSYFFYDFRMLFQTWSQKSCILLTISNCISINISYIEPLFKSSLTQLKCCIMWKFIQVNVILKIIHICGDLCCWDFSELIKYDFVF